MDRPSVDASEKQVVAFVRDWLTLAVEFGFEAALRELDVNTDGPAWSQDLFNELTFDHFDDGSQPKLTDPQQVEGLRVDAYRLDDGSGFAVEHDLPLDGKHSDFTAQFVFLKSNDTYRVYLRDIHIL